MTVPAEMLTNNNTTSEPLTVSIDHLSGVFNTPSPPDPRDEIYRNYIWTTLDQLVKVEKRSVGALMMGAGDMIWIDPAFQRCFVEG
ncbi:hypothetical protein BG004_002547, partial [Podila humilis]